MPVDALALREKRLVVSDACIDCNLCLPVCPMGALAGSEDRRRELSRVRHACDVVVAGAGPAGSVAATEAAKRGLSVLLIEKDQEIGSPVHCTEGEGPSVLDAFVTPDERWISAKVRTARIYRVR